MVESSRTTLASKERWIVYRERVVCACDTNLVVMVDDIVVVFLIRGLWGRVLTWAGLCVRCC